MNGPFENPRLERAAERYSESTGVHIDTARESVRAVLRIGSGGYGRGQRRTGAHGASGRSVGGRKTDRADDAAVILDREGLGGYVREHRFHPVRRWRLDFFWSGERVALEIEGRLPPWVDGKNVSHHTSWSGYESDCEKYSEAAVAGIRVIRCTLEMVTRGQMTDLVSRALVAAREGQT